MQPRRVTGRGCDEWPPSCSEPILRWYASWSRKSCSQGHGKSRRNWRGTRPDLTGIGVHRQRSKHARKLAERKSKRLDIRHQSGDLLAVPANTCVRRCVRFWFPPLDLPRLASLRSSALFDLSSSSPLFPVSSSGRLSWHFASQMYLAARRGFADSG